MESPAPADYVFLSYARAPGPGRRLTLRLQDALEGHGVACWRDETDTEAGRSWPIGISEALQKARAMVCVISAAAHDSHWVREEITMALRRDLGIPIVPVVAEADASLPYGINQCVPVNHLAGF